MSRNLRFLSAALKAGLVLLASKFAFADGNLQKVNHIIIVMQEKHSSTTTLARDLEGMFNFDTSPSLNSPVGSAKPPQDDCTRTALDRVKVR